MLADWLSQTIKSSDDRQRDDEQLTWLSDMNKCEICFNWYIQTICDALFSLSIQEICFTGYTQITWGSVNVPKFPPWQVFWAFRSDQYGVAEWKENHEESIHAGWVVIADDWELRWLAERWWAAKMSEWYEQMRNMLHWVQSNHLGRAIIIMKMRIVLQWVHPNLSRIHKPDPTKQRDSSNTGPVWIRSR